MHPPSCSKYLICAPHPTSFLSLCETVHIFNEVNLCALFQLGRIFAPTSMEVLPRNGIREYHVNQIGSGSEIIIDFDNVCFHILLHVNHIC